MDIRKRVRSYLDRLTKEELIERIGEILSDEDATAMPHHLLVDMNKYLLVCLLTTLEMTVGDVGKIVPPAVIRKVASEKVVLHCLFMQALKDTTFANRDKLKENFYVNCVREICKIEREHAGRDVDFGGAFDTIMQEFMSMGMNMNLYLRLSKYI